MPRFVSSALRTALTALSVSVSAGPALAQPDPTAPPPRPAPTQPSTTLPPPPTTGPASALPAPTAVPTIRPQEPAPMGWSAYPSPGAAFVAYPGLPGFYYPSYGYGYGALPPRAVYGPAVSPVAYSAAAVPAAPVYSGAYLPPRSPYGPSISPTEYPYTGFVPGYPYPGYTALSPYPRTVSSYSSGPSVNPVHGPVYLVSGPLGLWWR